MNGVGALGTSRAPMMYTTHRRVVHNSRVDHLRTPSSAGGPASGCSYRPPQLRARWASCWARLSGLSCFAGSGNGLAADDSIARAVRVSRRDGAAHPGGRPAAVLFDDHFNNWTHELRLSSPVDSGRIKWVAGAFFADQQYSHCNYETAPGYSAAFQSIYGYSKNRAACLGRAWFARPSSDGHRRTGIDGSPLSGMPRTE